MALAELADTLQKIKEYKDTHKAEFYEPYDYQIEYHCAKDLNGDLSLQKSLMAANQVGKTFCAAMEVTYHATGLYPDWWTGHRFTSQVQILVSGHRNESVRDICQAELLGDPFDESAFGTGTIQKHLIGKPTRKAGVPNALTAVTVKHTCGKFSKIRFMAYEQGADAFMGIKFDIGWGDEEPPLSIWTQMIRSTFSRKQYVLLLTFTPENGVTEVVDGFMNHVKAGQSLTRATWEDAPHMTKEKREAYIAQLPPHERDMRSRGIPLMGSGLVFPISDESVMVDSFPIPKHWSRIVGMDIGIDHPFAAAWLAHDRDTDIVYVVDCYRERNALISTQSSAIKKRGQWIPVVWPHDGLQRDPKSGVTIADLYRDEGLNMRPDKFSNPPAVNQKEGQGGQGVEAGIMEMYNRMETGRLKVFSHLSDWFEERRQYHRKDGQIVKLRDDLMAATRYAMMSLRFAVTEPTPRKRINKRQGLSNW